MPWRFFFGVPFVLVCFVFRLYAFVEAAALRSIVLRYAGVPIATRFFLFLFFFLLEMSLFPSVLYHFRFLFVWRVRRTFFSSGWCFFYLVTTGWIFYISLCENSINSIDQSEAYGTSFVLLVISILVKTSCGGKWRRFAAEGVHDSFMNGSGSSPPTHV